MYNLAVFEFIPYTFSLYPLSRSCFSSFTVVHGAAMYKYETGKPKFVRGGCLGFQHTLVDLILNAQATGGEPPPSTMAIPKPSRIGLCRDHIGSVSAGSDSASAETSQYSTPQLLKDMLLEGNTLPNCNYEAKKILCSMRKSLKRCINALSVGNHGIKRKMGHPRRYYGIFQLFQDSSNCLLMQMMKRTLDDMKYDGQLHHVTDQCNGRKLIVCFQLSIVSQETLGLDLLQYDNLSTNSVGDLQPASLAVHKV
ncbi:hypothetical protein CR513_10985, partial [Mucuna pruriens]